MNAGAVNAGTASQGASATWPRSRAPKYSDSTKPTKTPEMIGTRRKMPRPNTATIRVVSRVGMEIHIAVL